MLTARDLYAAVVTLTQEPATPLPTLETYLVTLHSLARTRSSSAQMPLAQFFELLSGALHGPTRADASHPAPTCADHSSTQAAGFAEWERTILEQISDLRSMDRDGSLHDQLRHVGLEVTRPADAADVNPRSWYNFDPMDYLECATAGAFDYQDDGDRDEVPRTSVINSIGWEKFTKFLICGQIYE